MKESIKKAKEILAKNGGMLLERMNEQPDRILITPNEALSAMEEYAEEMACGFLEWKDIYFETFIISDELNPKLSKTTKELYQLYLEHLNK